MTREPASDRRQLLDTLQGLLDALPRPDGGRPLRAEDVLSFLETGRRGGAGTASTDGGAGARSAAGDAAVEASLRLVVEAFTALAGGRGETAGPR
ncbi:hypothetical protein [Streptomyces sp. NPDC000983]|uniref:hypothetical protein n=1 Tax=Streptomyces sp. NPDC000983 TaxID=3154373 RepID=UPI0033335F65